MHAETNLPRGPVPGCERDGAFTFELVKHCQESCGTKTGTAVSNALAIFHSAFNKMEIEDGRDMREPARPPALTLRGMMIDARDPSKKKKSSGRRQATARTHAPSSSQQGLIRPLRQQPLRRCAIPISRPFDYFFFFRLAGGCVRNSAAGW